MAKEIESREFQKGERVGLYVVVRRESGGGHGALYKVHHHLLLESFYALKVLHASLRNNADIVKRMEREAQVLSLMRHDNIVRVFDTGKTDERDPETGAILARPYIAMEWLKGRTLAYSLSTARHRGVGLLPALDIGIEVADALDHVHSHGVVHRDIKPENIFLQFAPGRPNSTLTKLLDFGIARLLGAQKITMRETMVGTALYASPEQARGEDPTAQTDAYAFGLVLYEMLVGRHPFEHAVRGNDMYPLLQAHISEKPAPFSIHEVPASLARLVMSCLEKNPRFRPASMVEIARELRKLYNEFEEQAKADLASLSKTEPTPVQNTVTQAGGEVTDPGPPPEKSPRPALTAPDAPIARHRVDPNQPVRETRRDGVGAGNTQRMDLGGQAPTYVPPAQTPVNRAAMTRTAEPFPIAAPRTGTDPTARTVLAKEQAVDPRLRTVGDKVIWVDLDEGPRSPRPNSSGLSSAEESTTSSAGAVAMISRSPAPIPTPPGVRRTVAVVAIAAMMMVLVGFGVVVFALSSRHPDATHPSATTTTPASSAESLVAPARSQAQPQPPPPPAAVPTTTLSTSTSAAVPTADAGSLPAPASSSARPSKPRPVPPMRPKAVDLPDGFKTKFE
jgi:serine/threonine protein kinase